MKRLLSIVTCGIGMFLSGCASRQVAQPPAWGEGVSREVSALGVSNWIIVAESSFPVMSRRGVRTMVVDAEIPELVDYIVNDLEKSAHVIPRFNTARELPFVENDNAPGIDEFRRLLKEALHGNQVREMDHRSLTLLAHSDVAKYAVLVLKTRSALPYSNVFIELDSGFWDRDSEDKLRSEISAAELAAQKAAQEAAQKAAEEAAQLAAQEAAREAMQKVAPRP